MLNVTIQHSEDMAVLRCVGRIVAGDEANILRKAVLSQVNSRTVVFLRCFQILIGSVDLDALKIPTPKGGILTNGERHLSISG